MYSRPAVRLPFRTFFKHYRAINLYCADWTVYFASTSQNLRRTVMRATIHHATLIILSVRTWMTCSLPKVSFALRPIEYKHLEELFPKQKLVFESVLAHAIAIDTCRTFHYIHSIPENIPCPIQAKIYTSDTYQYRSSNHAKQEVHLSHPRYIYMYWFPRCFGARRYSLPGS